MTNLRAEGLRVFRELMPDSLPEDDREVDFGGGFAPPTGWISDSRVYSAPRQWVRRFPAANTARNVAAAALTES